MKRGNIIALAFIAYLVAMVAMFFGVNSYITSKDNRLRNEMHDKIDELFAGRKQYVDVAYSGYKVGYEKVAIPTPPKPTDIKSLPDSLQFLADANKRIAAKKGVRRLLITYRSSLNWDFLTMKVETVGYK